MRWGVILAVALAVSACGRAPSEHEKEQMDRALRNFGFTNGRDYAFSFLACDKNDSYRFTFRAENSHGETVTGQACAGLFFKGWTVRTD